MKKLARATLRQFYEGDYASHFPSHADGKIRQLLTYLSFDPHDKIVDYGCGNGLLLDFVGDQVAEYYGIDFSEQFIQRAQERVKSFQMRTQAYFLCADIRHFGRQHVGYFDKAFTFDFSEHLYDEDFLAIYASIRMSLKDGGNLYLHTPNLDFFIERLKDNDWLRQPEHVAVRTARQYQDLLTQVEFRNIAVHYVPHYVRLLSVLQYGIHIPVIGKYLRARLLVIAEK